MPHNSRPTSQRENSSRLWILFVLDACIRFYTYATNYVTTTPEGQVRSDTQRMGMSMS